MTFVHGLICAYNKGKICECYTWQDQNSEEMRQIFQFILDHKEFTKREELQYTMSVKEFAAYFNTVMDRVVAAAERQAQVVAKVKAELEARRAAQTEEIRKDQQRRKLAAAIKESAKLMAQRVSRKRAKEAKTVIVNDFNPMDILRQEQVKEADKVVIVKDFSPMDMLQASETPYEGTGTFGYMTR